MRRVLKGAVILTILKLAVNVAYSQENGTFSLPHSVLLLAAPYSNVTVVAGGNAQVLDPPVKQGGVFSSPSLAFDGSRVAWAFFAEDPRVHRPPRYAVGVYALDGHEWKLYGDFGETGPVSFSADGSKIAFVGEESGGKNESFMILDLSTGEIAPHSNLSRVLENSQLSWSPHGKELAVAIYRPDHPSSVAIVNPETTDVKIIGEGIDPVWSPTGDWIAYFNESREKCILVHPDGTGTRVIRNLGRRFGGYRMFVYGAVWSPDGKQLLLNELKGEGPNIDVMLFDLGSGRVTRKARNGLPVFGWINQRTFGAERQGEREARKVTGDS